MNLKLSHPLSRAILFLACAALLLMGMMQAAPVQACQHSNLENTTETAVYQVITGPLRIRDAPDGNIIGVLLTGQTVAVSEYAEIGDYVWGRHGLGWSALHTPSCEIRYVGHTDAAPDIPAPADDADEDDASGDAPPADSAPVSPPAAAPAGGDNLCQTVWTFCNSGTPEQNAYFWRLGFFASAVQRGEIAGDPKDLVEGRTPPARPALPSPEATAEP